MENLTKLSFGFTPEDMKLLNELKDKLRITEGTLSNIAVVRKALRVLARQK